MEEVLKDVTKVHEHVVHALGHDKGVDPNQIFVKLEELVGEESSLRVKKVAQRIISELEPPRTRLKSDVLENEKNLTENISDSQSQNDDIVEMGEGIILGENSKTDSEVYSVGVLKDKEVGLDFDSLRSTPASVISITDEESQDGGTIDLTNFEEEHIDNNIDDVEEFNIKREGALNNSLEAGYIRHDPDVADILDPEEVMQDLEEIQELEQDTLENGLRNDTNKVLRILADEKGPLRDYDEVYAYLEAHIKKRNRVQIVVEEFLGMVDRIGEEGSRSPSPQLRQPSPIISGKCKGKGKGKKTVNAEPLGKLLGVSAISPEIDVKAKKREHSPEEDLSKKFKAEDTAINKEDTKSVVEKAKVKKEKKERPSRSDPITEEMLYGPFDFSKHRNDVPKTSRRTQNLAPRLQDIVEDSTRKFTLTPSKLSYNSPLQAVQPTIPPTTTLPHTPPRNYIAPAKLTPVRDGQEGQNSPVTHTPPLTPRAPVIHPAKLTIMGGARRDRQPSVEVVREEIAVDKPREVVEIPDNDPPATSAEVASLAENLGAMFPDTPADYILARCQDLVGKNAAINRFTEELLLSSQPPDNWRLIYKPFNIVQENIPVELDDPHVDQAVVDADNPPVVAGTVTISDAPTHNDELVINDNSTPPVNEERNQTDSAPSSSDAGPSTSIGDPDADPMVYWETEKQEQMVSMFPNICPDWLLQQVQFISRAQERTADNNGSSAPVQPPLNKNQMDLMFQAKVEELFSMSSDERGKLPTRVQWEARKKQIAELEKWSGKMSVKDMLELYEDDPAGYFNDPQRKPESESYKQHALSGLKDEFRFHSITEIEKAFKKCRCLYTPAFKQLNQMMKNGKKTRKTHRPDFDIKYPSDPCIEFLKEKKFCELEEQITAEKLRMVADREAAVEAARERGELVECKCCYSADCLEEDMVQCKGGHMYCKECISRGTSVAIGDGKTIIECLGHCSEEIGWQELQKALAPNVLSKLLQRRQAEEVGAAGLESLVTCPFCPYQTIMENMDDKILACRNPDCGRESCRLCKEPSHVPLRCDEVEKKDEEEARKKIEEQLSEAMIRECWKCKAKYFKEEGCNKMTCPKPNCGAKMCYLCKQPVKDYTHFYGQGGSPTATKTCPLWTDNQRLHEQEIANAAAKAKEELAKSNLTLKHDPTKGIAAPAGGAPGFGVAAPDLAEVIAPGVPREEIVRQQRQIEDMIRHGARVGPMWGPHGQPHPPPLHVAGPAHAWQDGFIQRMGEILRLREQNRVNLRMVRQREQQAIRELQRQQQQPNHPIGPFGDNAGIRAFGIPQAVPEPAPFLDLVEAQGRNIHVVQQPRVPIFAGPGGAPVAPGPGPFGPLHEHFRNFHGRVPERQPEAGGVRDVADEVRRREENRRRRDRHMVFLEEGMEDGRRRAARMRLEQDRVRQRQVTEHQRERAQRSREEAVRRLRRNREEVLRRQRRNREPGNGMERRNRDEGAEVRVERVPNAYQMAGQRVGVNPGQPVPRVAHVARGAGRAGAVGGEEGPQAGRNPAVAAREFNFQEILDLDALNPAYLGEELGNV